MKQYYTLLILFSCISTHLHASLTVEQQINQYINDYELPRLSKSYPNARVEITLDNRANLNYLQACNHPIQIKNQRKNTKKRTTYEITCTSPSWRFFVPIAQKVFISAIKTTSPIKRKEDINQQNTTVDEVDITQINGKIYSPQDPPYGLVAKRNIKINTFLTDILTELPILIKRGQKVLITAKSGEISVRMNGVSTENGVLGQQIKVKNSSSGRFVYGRVISDSEIQVNY
ncbi:flagellar basal body P-ring formation protein FlgA [Marinomonas agarivorans]|nr:flagellar basal body P-ring formation protein FlgA [Marinomonas agarivorans]